MTLRSALATVAALACLLAPPARADDAPGQGRAILITGASSGIGRLTAELLADNGFYVYAGARKQEDIDALDALDNIEAVKLDVTIQQDIDAAVEQVRAGGKGLYGLINNAGVAVLLPMIEVDDEDVEFQFDVNVMGPIRVTRAFAPMLIESQGRISTTGSIAGSVTHVLGGPYTMSKHCIEAYTETLIHELTHLGVTVSVVDPGAFDSKIIESAIQRLEQRNFTTEGSRYQRALESLMQAGDRSMLRQPDIVAEAFLHAMTDPDPKRRYMVAAQEFEALWAINTLMQRIVELNEDQPYEFDRDTLVAMLDAALNDESGDPRARAASALE